MINDDTTVCVETDSELESVKNALLNKSNECIMSLGYYDDGKGKYQSFEVGLNYTDIEDKLSQQYSKFNISTLDLECLRGYGQTKEEALQEFIKYYDAIVEQLVMFRNILHEKGDNMVELDCFFKPF